MGLITPSCTRSPFALDKQQLNQRLEQFPKDELPIEMPVTVYWNKRQVPFIHGQTDEDVAFALGLVHAHLRLGQLELFRHLAQGRLSEILGVMAVDVDRTIRTLELGSAVASIRDQLPRKTRRWIERFVEGINYIIQHSKKQPPEFGLFNYAGESWTVEDVLLLTRLMAVDKNWFTLLKLLELRQIPQWTQVWQELKKHSLSSIPSYKGTSGTTLEDLLNTANKAGSNAWAVSSQRSNTGAPILACDPHSALQLPSIWLLGGFRSPSYQVVGLMIPGIPAIVMGRNSYVAWGSTNMHAASTDLVQLPEDEHLDSTTRTITVRGWFDTTLSKRRSRFGPVLSDAPLLNWKQQPFALRWVGHIASDEISALLKINKARNFVEFWEALDTWAVPGLNFIYADTQGNIGHILAAKLPNRQKDVMEDIFC